MEHRISLEGLELCLLLWKFILEKVTNIARKRGGCPVCHISMLKLITFVQALILQRFTDDASNLFSSDLF
jgi:hypothetical protein